MHKERKIHAFRSVPRTGVIFVTTEAARLGFTMGDSSWCNLGQGQPDTGDLEGAPPRVHSVDIAVDDQEYAPIAGIWELREAIASFYNNLYRRGLPSQYTAENVCVSGGGRAALTRAAASLGTINLGHFLPDYTAYEELLDIFKAFASIPILLEGERGYVFTAEDLRREILGRGLSAVLLSNPSNPTGKLVDGAEMQRWVSVARELDCTLMLDEFYSHYVYREGAGPAFASAAQYVEDVDNDPVLLFDGLTKNWRYPGWRVTWTLGPKHVVDTLASAGSFLDGGGSKPLQRAAIPLLSESFALQETKAIQTAFRVKRDKMLEGLARLGITVDNTPEGTFYIWGNVSALPSSICEGMGFFHKALEHKVICIPGEFFDINPGKRRSNRTSRFRTYVRFSFGPPLAVLEKGLSEMQAMVQNAR